MEFYQKMTAGSVKNLSDFLFSGGPPQAGVGDVSKPGGAEHQDALVDHLT